ncbi:MAG: hypothetical protein CMN78_06510 [Spirochaetales bacterium]|nr:hypothetical protein [Spirochaetales bacterium]
MNINVRMRKWLAVFLFVIAAAVVGAITLPSYFRTQKYRRWIEGKFVDAPAFLRRDGGNEQVFERITPSQPKPAYDFQLTNMDNTTVRLADYREKLLLMGFIYTSCPDVCGTITQHFLYIQRRLAEEIGNNLALAFITTDPEKDTPERLSAYTKGYEGNWDFMTGTKTELEEVWEEYHVGVLDGRSESGTDLVYHSFMVVLIDRNGFIRHRYIGVVDPEEVIVKDIEMLLLESS